MFPGEVGLMMKYEKIYRLDICKIGAQLVYKDKPVGLRRIRILKVN